MIGVNREIYLPAHFVCRISFLQKQGRIIVPILLETRSKGRDVLVGDMPGDAAVDLAIAVSDEIPEASNLSPRIIREGGRAQAAA